MTGRYAQSVDRGESVKPCGSVTSDTMPATPFPADSPPQEDALQTGNVDQRIIPVLAAGLDPVAD